MTFSARHRCCLAEQEIQAGVDLGLRRFRDAVDVERRDCHSGRRYWGLRLRYESVRVGASREGIRVTFCGIDREVLAARRLLR